MRCPKCKEKIPCGCTGNDGGESTREHLVDKNEGNKMIVVLADDDEPKKK